MGRNLLGGCSACSAVPTIASLVDREMLRRPKRLRTFGLLLYFGLLRPLEPCLWLECCTRHAGSPNVRSSLFLLILVSRKLVSSASVRRWAPR